MMEFRIATVAVITEFYVVEARSEEHARALFAAGEVIDPEAPGSIEDVEVVSVSPTF